MQMLLTMLQDSDMEIRRLAMTTLNSAAHNKPDLILPHLGLLMPYVLAESVIKPELIREVMMGPFKHLVDDGLEVRKVRGCPTRLPSADLAASNAELTRHRALTRHFTRSWRQHSRGLTILTFWTASSRD